MIIPVRGWACGCGEPSPAYYLEEEKSAAAVFLGQATKLEVLPNASLDKYKDHKANRVYFRVTKAWKGVDKPIVTIETIIGQSSMCEGYLFEVDASYLVVTDKNGLRVDELCSYTHRMNLTNNAKLDKDILNALGNPERVFDQP